MTLFLLMAAALVLGTVTIALGRLLLSAQAVDWVMAAQVLGTAGIASLLLFGIATGSPGVIDTALLLALLAAFATVAFAARLGIDRHRSGQDWAAPPTTTQSETDATVGLGAVDDNAKRSAARHATDAGVDTIADASADAEAATDTDAAHRAGALR